MKKKREPNFEAVEQIKGTTSRLLISKCPDMRSVFPSTPCTNLVCEYRIRSEGYLNCSFVAATAEDEGDGQGGMTLEAIAEVLDDEPVTREAVRLIEKKLLRKLRVLVDGEADGSTPVRQPRPLPGRDHKPPRGQSDQRSNERDNVRAVDDRKLG